MAANPRVVVMYCISNERNYSIKWFYCCKKPTGPFHTRFVYKMILIVLKIVFDPT